MCIFWTSVNDAACFCRCAKSCTIPSRHSPSKGTRARALRFALGESQYSFLFSSSFLFLRSWKYPVVFIRAKSVRSNDPIVHNSKGTKKQYFSLSILDPRFFRRSNQVEDFRVSKTICLALIRHESIFFTFRTKILRYRSQSQSLMIELRYDDHVFIYMYIYIVCYEFKRILSSFAEILTARNRHMLNEPHSWVLIRMRASWRCVMCTDLVKRPTTEILSNQSKREGPYNYLHQAGVAVWHAAIKNKDNTAVIYSERNEHSHIIFTIHLHINTQAKYTCTIQYMKTANSCSSSAVYSIGTILIAEAR